MQAALDTLWREKSGAVLATLIRLLRDVDLAEEALAQAFLAAASDWPRSGLPANPTAWLISAGRFRAIDQIRRNQRQRAHAADLAPLLNEAGDDAAQPMDLLALIFTCCHPALSQDAQVALTLRSVCGLTTEEIAAAFLLRTPTMAQRISRAKAQLRDGAIAFEMPNDLNARLGPVLAVIYLIFNQGYGAPASPALIRPDLAAQAIALARDVHALRPDAEVKGLLALMLFGAARQGARLDDAGEVVLLADQNRALWDAGQIAQAQALVDAAFASGQVGPYVLQAAIAALHAAAPTYGETDWPQILALYTVLMRLAPSPIVALNRAVALGAARGQDQALALIEPLVAGPLASYGPAHAALGTVLGQLGHKARAAMAFRAALDVTTAPPLRRHLQRQIAAQGAEFGAPI